MSYLSNSLLPSPAWFQAKALDCSLQGHLAYACRMSIVILDLKEKPKLYDYFTAHDSRVLSVSFCKSKNILRLASSCENTGVIKIWNVKEKVEESLSLCLEFKHPAFVEWKYGSEETLYFAQGRALSEWCIHDDRARILQRRLGHDIIILSSCPGDPNKLAVGHKGGQISIIDVLNHNCIFKSREHSGDITSLSWSPFNFDQIVSASVGGKVKMWNLSDETDGIRSFTHVPHVSRKADMSARANKCWVSTMFHPQDPNLVIASNYFGDLVMFGSFQEKPETTHFKTETGGHDRIVYTILPNHCDKNIVITYSMDKNIVFWDLEQKKSVFQIPTLPGIAYYLTFSPHDSVRLGIASRDGTIHIWNTTKSSKNPFKSFNYSIKGQVNVLAWHPEKEGLLAFSSDDGRIGVLETLTTKAPTYFPRNHPSNVYSLTWGPCPKLDEKNAETKKLYLYSCGAGKITVQNTSSSSSFMNFNDILGIPKEEQRSVSYSEVSFKEDYSLLAVGTNQGDVMIYSGSNLKLLAKLEVLKRQIQCLRWHPMQVSMTSTQCAMHQWLACSSNECNIVVFDLTDITNNPQDEPVVLTSATHKLRGHVDKIPSLCWSPHVEGQLASASYDKTIEVWDVVSETSIATFNEHRTRIMYLTYSLVDPDVIFSASDDGFVYQWKISEVKPSDIVKKKTRRQPRKIKIKVPVCEVKQVQNDAIENGVVSPNAEAVQDNPSKVNIEEEEESDDVDSVVPRTKAKKHTPPKKTFFKQTNFLLNAMPRHEIIADSMKLADDISTERNLPLEEDCHPYMGFFRDRSTFYRTFEAEIDYVKDVDELSLTYYEVWRGNVKDLLSEVAAKGKLTDFHLSIAAQVSRRFWLEMCEKYASQLVGKRDFVRASMYLLMCNKLLEAITLLKNYSNPRDALALAKLRLPEDDPVIDESLELWSSKFKSCGKMEVAANCFIAMKKPLEAAQIIMKKSDALSAKLAAHVCRAFNHGEEAKNYTVQCVQFGLMSSDWTTVQEALDLEPSLKGLLVALAVHKAVRSELEAEHKEFGLSTRMFPDHVLETDTVIWKCHSVEGKPYLQHLYDILAAEGFWVIDSQLLDLARFEVSNWLNALENSKSLQSMVYAVALHITLFYLSLQSQNEQDTIKHLNRALCHSLGALELNFMDIICQMLFPFDISWNAKERKVQVDTVTVDAESPISLVIGTIVNSVSNFPITKTLTHLNDTHPVFSHDDLPCLLDINNLIDSASSVDVYAAFFAINMINRMKNQVTEQNVIALCDRLSNGKDLKPVDEDNIEMVTSASPQSQLEENEFPTSNVDDDHMLCTQLTAMFVEMSEMCVSLVCKDIFAAAFHIKHRKNKIQSDLLAIKMQSKSQTHQKSQVKLSSSQNGQSANTSHLEKLQCQVEDIIDDKAENELPKELEVKVNENAIVDVAEDNCEIKNIDDTQSPEDANEVGEPNYMKDTSDIEEFNNFKDTSMVSDSSDVKDTNKAEGAGDIKDTNEIEEYNEFQGISEATGSGDMKSANEIKNFSDNKDTYEVKESDVMKVTSLFEDSGDSKVINRVNYFIVDKDDTMAQNFSDDEDIYEVLDANVTKDSNKVNESVVELTSVDNGHVGDSAGNECIERKGRNATSENYQDVEKNDFDSKQTGYINGNVGENQIEEVLNENIEKNTGDNSQSHKKDNLEVKANLNEEDETQKIVLEMERQFAHLNCLGQLLNSIVKDQSYPSPLHILKAINDLCDISNNAKIACPKVSLVLSALSNELEMWAAKLKVD